MKKINLAKYEEYIISLNLSDKINKLFKSILEDAYVSFEELTKLTFEQAQILNKILNDCCLDEISISWVRIEKQVGLILSATVLTNDNKFNKSIYNMMKQEKDWMRRSDLFLQIQEDLFETYGKKSKDYLDWYINEKDNIDMKINDFLKKMNKKHQKNLDKALKNSDILDGKVEQYERKVNQYKILVDTYS